MNALSTRNKLLALLLTLCMLLALVPITALARSEERR